MTQPAPGYQPYQPMPPMMGAPVTRKPSRGGLTTLLAGVLALVVAGLAVGGSFGAISTYRNGVDIDGDQSVYASKTTWWGFSDDGSSSPIEDTSVLAGLTLVLAALSLVVGAVFAFLAARSGKPGPVAGMRSLISAGVGVLAGVSLLQLFSLLEQMEQYNEQELDAGQSLEFSAGLGMWLPLSGLLLGLVAVVLAHVGQRPDQSRMEPNTPRMGFPAPYGYRPRMPAQAPVSERVTDVQISDEDAAADTQVVSAAAAGGAPSDAAPATPAPVTPPTAFAAAPVEPPAAPAPAPATTTVPEPPAAEAPVTPATTSVPEPPAAPVDGPAGEAPAPTPLSDLPAAPPAPEPSSSDDKNDK